MQNPLLKFRLNSIISEKPGYMPEKLKTLTSSNYHKVRYFLLKFCTRFLPNNTVSTKGSSGARQSSQSFRQNTWFLENNRALSNFFKWDFSLLN